MFIVKCGAASSLEPVLRILRSDWSRHFISFIKTPNNHNNDFPMVNITIFTIRLVIRKMLLSWDHTLQGRKLSCCQGPVLAGDGDPGEDVLASPWQNGSCSHHNKCGKQMLSQMCIHRYKMKKIVCLYPGRQEQFQMVEISGKRYALVWERWKSWRSFWLRAF